MFSLKNILAGLLSLLILPLFAQENPSGAGIRNSGFETLVEEKPEWWKLEGTVTVDNADFYAGRHGLAMKHGASASSSARQSLEWQAGEDTLQVWVKLEDVKGGGAHVRLRKENGDIIAESAAMTDTAAWQLVKIPFALESGQRVNIELSLTDSAGSVWFDDIAFASQQKDSEMGKSRSVVSKDENMALGKSYTLNPLPNYPDSSDSGDLVQLTDGQFTEGYFWSQKSTVGWVTGSPQVTIDLGKVEPIEEIVIHSVGGGVAGVHFPNITCYVSDDLIHSHKIAHLTPEGLTEGGEKWYTHAFSTGALKTRGRYVTIHFRLNGSTVFTDEIEVKRGSFEPSSVTFESQPIDHRDIALSTIGVTSKTYTSGYFPESPHVDWAAPLSGGPIKALLLNFSEGMRAAVEIAQRVDLDYTPVSHWAFYKNQSELPLVSQQQIADALPTLDVMIVGAFHWQAMSPELLGKIRTRVQEGMGLICIDNGDVIGSDNVKWVSPLDALFENRLEGDQDILKLIPMELIPKYTKPRDSHFQLATYGKGRVALLNPGTFTRPVRTLLPSFRLEDYVDETNGPLEYYHSAFAKLILWSSNRDTSRLKEITASPEKINVKINAGEKAGKLVVETRDPFFKVFSTQEKEIPATGGVFEFETPESLGGVNTVDVWLRDNDGAIIDWGSHFYKKELPVHIGKITPGKSLFEPEEAVVAKVKVEGESKDNLKLRATLFDTDDRQVAAPRIFPVAGDQETEIEISYKNPQTLAAKLFVELLRDDVVLEKKMERIWVEIPQKHDFTVLGWYALDKYPEANFCMKVLHALGVDMFVSLTQLYRGENAAYGNLRLGPEDVARVAPPESSDGGLERDVCLSDPKNKRELAAKLRSLAKESRRFGVTEWSMGDEESLGNADYCFSSSCLEEFRVYLHGRYADLDALNASWGSGFKTWDEVMPSTFSQIDAKSSIAPWLEHRRYMETLFSDYHAKARETIVKENPHARVGLSGTQNPTSYNGYDWWKLTRAVNHISGYEGIQAALQRSFAQPDTFSTRFLGYDYADDNEQAARSQIWELLFNGANGVNYYTLISHTLNCPLIRPDLSLARQGEWFFKEVKEIKEGLGRLFIESKYENDRIAVHYSPSSVHSATAGDLFNFVNKRRNFQVNLTNLGRLLEESHYQYSFIHEEQMVRGDLKNYKVLFLPWSSAISLAEAAAIREFVENGGVVIADSFCGVRDDHGKPQAMLDDLFGIQQPLRSPELRDRVLKIEDADFTGPATVPVTSGIRQIKLDGGTARASVSNAPAFITNKVGKGQAIFLNASFSNYAEQVSGGVGGEIQVGSVASQDITTPIRAFVTAILTEVGIPTPMPVTTENVTNSEIQLSRFSLGETRLLGIIREIKSGAVDLEDTAATSITLGETSHIYDSRDGRYFGEKDTLNETFPRGIAKVYALLPYKVEGVSIHGKKEILAGSDAKFSFAIKAAESNIGTHVFHISVKDPDGKERLWYAQNLVGNSGKAETTIPFAYNDPEGEWEITVKDVLTGETNSITVTLKHTSS